MHGPGGDVADERCLPIEADDCAAVEEHVAAPVIGPVMVEQAAPGGGLDARRAEGVLEEAANLIPSYPRHGQRVTHLPTDPQP